LHSTFRNLSPPFATFSIYVILTLSFVVPASGQESPTVQIFPPDSNPFGLPYQSYIMKTWERSYELDEDENPLLDSTGERCNNGQDPNSPVFILVATAGGNSERTCEIPAGKGLLIEVVSVAASFAETTHPESATIDELYNITKNDQDNVEVKMLMINGQKFNELHKYRFVTEPFNISFPPNNIWGVDAGNSTAVAEGYFVITEPLAPGKYDIRTTGKVGCTGQGCDPYATGVKYNLIVE